MGVHVIPVVIEIHGDCTRQEAFEIVRSTLSATDWFLPGHLEVRTGYPNDDFDGHFHLEFAPGPPPEDLDDTTTYRQGGLDKEE